MKMTTKSVQVWAVVLTFANCEIDEPYRSSSESATSLDFKQIIPSFPCIFSAESIISNLKKVVTQRLYMSGKHSSVCRAGLVSRIRLGTWRQNVVFLSCVWERELIVTLALAGCALWERTRSHRNNLGLRAGIMKMSTPWPFSPSLASSFSGYQVNPRGHLMGSFRIPVSAVPSGGLSHHGCCLSKIGPW